MADYERKLPSTGYWIFVCNTDQWNADQWLELNEEILLYRISIHHQSEVQPGQLGVLRLNDDRRSVAARRGHPGLSAGIYAIFEVTGKAAFVPDTDLRHISDIEMARPRWRAPIRVAANLLRTPVLADDLPDTADFRYIHHPLQTSTIPLSEIAFRIIATRAGYPQLANGILLETPAPRELSPAQVTARGRGVFIANFGRENYEWPKCLAAGTVATMNGVVEQGFWERGDREGYIDYCVANVKTAAGLQPTRPVASRWFNLMTIVAESVGDIWIHREKDELWWTVSNSSAPNFSLETGPFRLGRDNVYVCHKPCEPWSNRNARGNRLDWNTLHPKAKEFLFTEGTLQRLSPDFANYATALVSGQDLSPWHSNPEWREKVAVSKREPAKIFNAKEISIARMASTAWETAARANGQDVLRATKIKDFAFNSKSELEQYISLLLESQEGLCAISGMPLQFEKNATDFELVCSLDRIDSNGHYARDNLQVVCKFINRWKSADSDEQFRRLLELVRRTVASGPDFHEPAHIPP